MAINTPVSPENSIFRPLLTSTELIESLESSFDWFSGVPDSDFAQTIDGLSNWCFATRENHAVGMAFGASLGGRRPALLMQNSGLGLSLDAIAGTFLLYEMPLTILVSNRGKLESEEPQHRHWGAVTASLLTTFGIKVFPLSELGSVAIQRAASWARETSGVTAVLFERGNISDQS